MSGPASGRQFTISVFGGMPQLPEDPPPGSWTPEPLGDPPTTAAERARVTEVVAENLQGFFYARRVLKLPDYPGLRGGSLLMLRQVVDPTECTVWTVLQLPRDDQPVLGRTLRLFSTETGWDQELAEGSHQVFLEDLEADRVWAGEVYHLVDPHDADPLQAPRTAQERAEATLLVAESLRRWFAGIPVSDARARQLEDRPLALELVRLDVDDNACRVRVVMRLSERPDTLTCRTFELRSPSGEWNWLDAHYADSWLTEDRGTTRLEKNMSANGG